MNAKSVQTIQKQIYRRFPEVDGARPSVKSQPSPKGRAAKDTYLLTFRGKVKESGRSFSRTVRVVANDSGKILKVSTSR